MLRLADGVGESSSLSTNNTFCSDVPADAVILFALYHRLLFIRASSGTSTDCCIVLFEQPCLILVCVGIPIDVLPWVALSLFNIIRHQCLILNLRGRIAVYRADKRRRRACSTHFISYTWDEEPLPSVISSSSRDRRIR